MHLELDIHNYYEHLVVERLHEDNLYKSYDKEFLADLCCLALSKLPARYIRHEVDMAFYLSVEQRTSMVEESRKAVRESLDYLLTKSDE
ncbi:late competence development ComFB family protein [Psychrobium sp. 1_MG-2023]|uniref:late competence development ComFB family protein n=1 Tax=Psychrobium sp. 1_MG-2023 TaxID=3062624 RepID=UPI000C33A6CA|nr:late competence development ComFB family protein [Psychrobium sp. 1_MG-2023]MDP2561553.1 late competence development ComFB family protein [Psychrobium sp. 1_MG-2023]PKF55016.1 competence protein ComFB [Alteromonadales bacterium alter-6D02]